MTQYPDLDDVLLIVAEELPGCAVRDPYLLESALGRPAATWDGSDLYLTLELKAAALLESLARNHALTDGNKRLALLALAWFLALNDRALDLSDPEAYELTMDAATAHLPVEDLAARISTRPLEL